LADLGSSQGPRRYRCVPGDARSACKDTVPDNLSQFVVLPQLQRIAAQVVNAGAAQYRESVVEGHHARANVRAMKVGNNTAQNDFQDSVLYSLLGLDLILDRTGQLVVSCQVRSCPSAWQN
jgi:hypothetical protein